VGGGGAKDLSATGGEPAQGSNKK